MEQEVLEWANQIEPTQSIDDLKNGVALCHLISRELFQDKRVCELKIRVINCSKLDVQSSIRNLTFALSLLEDSHAFSMKHITAQTLYQNPLKILQIMQQVKRQPTHSKPPKAPQKNDEQLFYVDENLVQPNILAHAEEVVVANKYRMIKPHSPYSRNESVFSNQEAQGSTFPRSVTHNTEFIEHSQKKDSIDSIGGLTPIKEDQQAYKQKLKRLEQEIQQLDKKIEKEKCDISHYDQNRKSSKPVSKSHDQFLVLSEETKENIVDWLKDIRLIKSNASGLQMKLPKICKNGLIFFDLLNRLSGKQEVLKGALRNPKNLREVKHNYRRVLEYLKQFERMNYRFLNSEQELAEGNEEIFWGLLNDIKQFYNSQAKKGTNITNDTSIQTHPQRVEKLSPKNIGSGQKPKPQPQGSHQPQQINQGSAEKPSQRQAQSPGPGSYSFKHTQKQEFDSVNKSLNSLMRKSNLNTSQGGTPINQSLSHSRNFSSSQQKKRRLSTSQSRNCVTREMELYVQTYFKQKQLYNNDNLFNDPIRNGDYIQQLIDNARPKSQTSFRSILEVEQNVSHALTGVKAMVDSGTLPAWLKSVSKENIMQLDKQAMGLYWWLLQGHHKPIDLTCTAQQQFTLPYKQEEIDQLKLISLHWARESCKSVNIQSFNDLILLCQSGTFLCQLISEVLKTKIAPIHASPVGEKQCLANIRKALDPLKGKAVGQKFLWQEERVFEGDQLIILGLFEDLRRFQDGLAQRQGDRYFEEGPYLNRSQQTTKLELNQIVELNCSKQVKPLSLIDQNQVNKRLMFEDVQVAPTKDWLGQFGIKVNWNNQLIDEFKDGTLLCSLLQRFEGVEFRGVQQKPQTTAGCMANIRKAFGVLKDKLEMPVDMIMEHEKVYQGDKEYLIRLMGVLKSIYRNKIRRN